MLSLLIKRGACDVMPGSEKTRLETHGAPWGARLGRRAIAEEKAWEALAGSLLRVRGVVGRRAKGTDWLEEGRQEQTHLGNVSEL